MLSIQVKTVSQLGLKLGSKHSRSARSFNRDLGRSDRWAGCVWYADEVGGADMGCRVGLKGYIYLCEVER